MSLCPSDLRITLPYAHQAEKAMAPHSSTLAWKIPWVEEPGGLQSTGSWRVGHDWVTSLSLFTFIHWRRKWQPTPVFLPGESQGQRSLAGYSPWGCRVGHNWSDSTQVLYMFYFIFSNVSQVMLFSKPFYKWETWGSEKLSSRSQGKGSITFSFPTPLHLNPHTNSAILLIICFLPCDVINLFLTSSSGFDFTVEYFFYLLIFAFTYYFQIAEDNSRLYRKHCLII